MKLSIVATLYRSASHLAEFHRRAMAAAEGIADDIEMVLVNDGSPDDSLAHALAIQATDPRVLVLDLARNFGHHKAMMTGLAHARGELVFLIDCDLEEQPELLPRFHAELLAGDWDVVYGVQRSRRGGLVERATGAVYFSLVGLLSDHAMPRNLCTVRLMRRPYVRALVAHRDRAMLISHLWLITGFQQHALPIDKLVLSPTSYSFARKFDMAVKFLTTSSTRLLYLILYFGMAICTLSLVTACFFLARYFANGVGVNGWTSIFVAVAFFGGVTVLILGIIGIYVANILAEVKRRPYTHLRAIHRAAAKAPAKAAPQALLAGEEPRR